jgi:hypothetical protein
MASGMKVPGAAIAAAMLLLVAWNWLNMGDIRFREQHRRLYDSYRWAEACKQAWDGYRPTIAGRIGQLLKGRLFDALAVEREVSALWSKQSIECAGEAR